MAEKLTEAMEIVRPHNNEREREVVAKAINKRLGYFLTEEAALDIAWTVLVMLRQAANRDAVSLGRPHHDGEA